MRPPALLLLPLLLAAAADPPAPNDTTRNDTLALGDDAILINNDTLVLNNGTVILLEDIGNDTLVELDGEHEPIVRKKRTFGDIVFRGLADVLGYSVARKPPQLAFPPPLPPVPGIDAPLQVSLTASAVQAAPPVQAAQAGPAPAPAPDPAPAPAAVAAPCAAPRAVAPIPCKAQSPPAPPPQPRAAAPPPCPKPRAILPPRPNPPPQPPPCGTPRANPPTPAPCAPASPPADNLERIQSNLQLSFNFNRNGATPAPAVAAAEAPVAEEQAQLQPPQPAPVVPLAPFAPVAPVAPISIQPRAAKLPPPQPVRKPRIYVDAFVVRNGVTQRVDTLDAEQYNPRRSAADEDYLYDDEDEELLAPPQRQPPAYDDYEDAQESRDRAKAVREFGTAVDRFWEEKKRQPQKKKNFGAKKEKKLSPNHYQNVHFGDRELANQIQRRSDSHENLQRERVKPNRIPQPLPEESEDDEVTTTTEDPKRRLKPRVLPPTEQNPGQIDTVTVRVPPIYKEKRPKKLHRERPFQLDRDDDIYSAETTNSAERDFYDSDGENSAITTNTEPPVRRRRRRKNRRKTRAAEKDQSAKKKKDHTAEETEPQDDGNSKLHADGESEAFTALDFDYYGNKQSISEEEKFYRELTVPPPTIDADVERHEKSAKGGGHFLDESERLREDPERMKEDYKAHADNDKEKSDESERADSRERSIVDAERTGNKGRADDSERTDALSPNARVHESGYQNNFVHATNVVVDKTETPTATVKKKTVKIGVA